MDRRTTLSLAVDAFSICRCRNQHSCRDGALYFTTTSMLLSHPGDPVQPSLGCDPPDTPRFAEGSEGLGGHVAGSGDHGQQPL